MITIKDLKSKASSTESDGVYIRSILSMKKMNLKKEC